MKTNEMIKIDNNVFKLIKRDYSRKEKIEKLQIESDKLSDEIRELEYENIRIDNMVNRFMFNPHYNPNTWMF